MTSNLLFDQSGVYVPQVCERVVLWRRDQTGDPLFGVEVPSAENAQRFANVFVIDANGLTDYKAAQAAEMAA